MERQQLKQNFEKILKVCYSKKSTKSRWRFVMELDLADPNFGDFRHYSTIIMYFG